MSYKILKYFAYKHLPEHLQRVSEPFCKLAYDVANIYGDEFEVKQSLRKLLEAKDCAVRACLQKGAS